MLEAVNPARWIQDSTKAFQSILDEQRRWQELLDAADPLRGIRETLDRADPSRYAREMIEALNPVTRFEEQLRESTAWTTPPESLFAESARTAEGLAKMLEAEPTPHAEAMDDIVRLNTKHMSNLLDDARAALSGNISDLFR
ncbi:MAG: hypothetical protein AB7G12_10990 [Thermoanaerobaculia bacterium]